MMKNILLVPLSLVSLMALGQDPNAGTGSQTGAVIKGLAPVAKDILAVKFPKPSSFRLKNGLTVYVLEDHRIPAIRLNLQLQAGSLFESKPSVAAATAAMLTEGTTIRTSIKMAEELENVGASLTASAGLDTATISASGLSDSSDLLVTLLSDVLLHPTFPADHLDKYRFSQRAGLSQRRTNANGLAGELTSQVFYGGTKYARSTPTREDLVALTTDDLARFHKSFYRPNDAILGVTGDVNPKELEKKLGSALATWDAAEKTVDLPEANFPSRPQTHVYLIDRPGSAQTVLQFGAPAVKQTDPDYIALTIANRILGGGSSGRLFQNIREKKGYTYGAYSSLTAGKWPGVWGANASVRTAVTEPAVGEFFFEFKRLQTEPVTADELDRAKRSIIGSFARTLESPEGILARTLELVQNGLPLDYWDKYPALIQAVSAADVQRVAAKYLGDRVQVIAVGERSKIEPGLTKYGVVQVVDPNKLSAISN